MEGTSLLGCVLTFQQAGWRARGCGGCCCWAVGGKGLWENQLLCVLWGTASREQSPSVPATVRAQSYLCTLPSQWRSGRRGTAMGVHTQAVQRCPCGILSFILYENWIYGCWVSLYFHMFLCGRTSFPLACHITLG